MKLTDFVNAQNEKKKRRNIKIREQSIKKDSTSSLCQETNYELSNLWYSGEQSLWDCALDNYWSYVKPANRELEEKMEELNWHQIAKLNTEAFYDFLTNEYFVWKYTAPNRLATTRMHLVKYKSESRMSELAEIQSKLFTFDRNDILYGLSIAKQINGLGVAGASGLLALFYPSKFATVDQFVVKALCSIENFNESSEIFKMKPESLSIKDGVVLIDIMKKKANKLNRINKTDFWTPRKIDKVLWTFGR